MIWRYTGRAAWGAAAAALTAVAPPLLFIHTAAWSEPLFLFCGLGGVALLAAYLQRGQLGFLASSGLLFAAGLLTRYAGICLVPTALVGIFLLSQQSLGMRLRDCLIFGLIACLPLAGWIVRNHNVSDESTDRSMVYHALTMDQLEEGFDTMRNWVLPDAPPRHVYSLAVSATMAGIMLLALLVVPPLMWRLSPEPADGLSRLPHLLWIFALFYLGTILLSQTFFDAGIPLDDRILSPIYAAGLLLLICLAYRWPGRGRPAALAAVVVIALLCFGADAVRGKSQLQKWHQRGAGLNRKPWVQCATLAALDELHLPPEAAIYSNAADAIEFRTARLASQLPNKSNEGMRQINSHYAKELADMSRRLRRTHGVIVLFAPNLSNRKYVATADELTAEFPLRLVAQCSDGEIYALDERPTSRP
jgi:hypothetical protein